MATGALTTTPRHAPAQGAVTGSRGSGQDEARVASLLQAAGQAHQAGQPDRVHKILEEVLDLDPDNVSALYNLGILYRDRGDVFAAEKHLRRSMRVDPGHLDAHQGLADLLFSVKQLLPAARLYEQALELAPNRVPLLVNLARTRMMLKEAPETERLARRILSIDEQCREAWSMLAWALLYGSGDAGDALRAAEEAERLMPGDPYPAVFRAHALRQLGRAADADAAWTRILEEARTGWARARSLNEAFYWLDQRDRSNAIINACVEANPDEAEVLKDLAALRMADGDFEGAQEALDRAAKIAPDHMVVRMVRGLNAFRLGDYRMGLELYEARWHRGSHDKPWDIPVPEWDGRPIDGNLVVYCEQGIGDYVMFALLFSELRNYAKSITIEVNSRVGSLFRRSFPDMPVVDRNSLPNDWNPGRYQAKVAMGDLPLRLNVDLENLPNRGGCLIPEPALTRKLRNRYRAMFPGKRLIGISWRSGNRDSATIRSVDLPLWKPIFETEDCAFISLQYGDNRRDLERLTAETGHAVYWDREIDPLQYMDPFTAQIAAMDLVISVDNSTVHFAGAIGKPCWVLLPLNADWRWLIDRTSSIWYDSLHLWRQRKSEGWERVVADVAGRLRVIGTEPLLDATAAMCLRCGEEMLRREAMVPAEDFFRWLMETGRHKAAAFHGVGMAALKARHDDAAGILGRAAELAPARVDYKADWAVALFEAGHRDMAERLARELTRHGNDPKALMAMGHILVGKHLPDQATDYFARVLRADPGHVMARTTLATLQATQGEHELARQNFARIVQQAPDLPAPRTALGEMDLQLGNDGAAWPNFAWRFGAAPDELPGHLAMIAPDDRPKSLRGERIRRRRLFLRAERNPVEQLLFAPWFAEAAADARAVRAECPPAVLPLLSQAFPKIRFAAAGTLTPGDLIAERTQLCASLSDLAATYTRGPAGGWLEHDRAAAAAHRARWLAGGAGARVIGLAWQTGDAPHGGLAPFIGLLEVPGIRWVMLPVGAVPPALSELLAAPDSPLVFEPAVLGTGLDRIAAVLGALDMVVSGEDLLATLAGAIGKPVWRIGGPAMHWSWLAEGAASKWHPTARIFRGAGGTAPSMTDIRTELEHFAGAVRPGDI